MCHQTAAVLARELEAAGIPTVLMGSAFDILRLALPPRTAFVNYPLGHPCGRPFEFQEQQNLVRSALQLLEAASPPGLVRALDVDWGETVDYNALLGGVIGDYGQGGSSDVRQPRDLLRRYQKLEDMAGVEPSFVPGAGADPSIAVVSPEALRQAKHPRRIQ